MMTCDARTGRGREEKRQEGRQRHTETAEAPQTDRKTQGDSGQTKHTGRPNNRDHPRNKADATRPQRPETQEPTPRGQRPGKNGTGTARDKQTSFSQGITH